MTNDHTATVDSYFEMWNEPDPERRAEHIRRAWTDDGSYADPLIQAAGHPGLGDMVAAAHAQYLGYRFSRLSGIDAHNGYLRFDWQLAGPDGEVAVAGVDIGELADDGRLRRITGFFGAPPAA